MIHEYENRGNLKRLAQKLLEKDENVCYGGGMNKRTSQASEFSEWLNSLQNDSSISRFWDQENTSPEKIAADPLVREAFFAGYKAAKEPVEKPQLPKVWDVTRKQHVLWSEAMSAWELEKGLSTMQINFFVRAAFKAGFKAGSF